MQIPFVIDWKLPGLQKRGPTVVVVTVELASVKLGEVTVVDLVERWVLLVVVVLCESEPGVLVTACTV